MDDRSWMVLRNGAWASLLKGGSMLIALAMIPAYLQLFEDKGSLGVWLAALSVVNLLLSLDFGVGNGTRNSLVASLEAQRWDSVRREIAGAYGAASLLAIVLAVPAFLSLAFVDWESMSTGAPEHHSEELRLLVVWLVATVALQFVLRTISFVLYALQRSAVNSVMAFSTSALVLLFVVVAGNFDGLRLAWLGPAYLIAVNLPLALASVLIFAGPLRRCRPWRAVEVLSEVPTALRRGMAFFINQLLYTALLGTSTVMVVAVAGSEGVVSYQAHYTLFSLSGILSMLALTPLWSAVTHARVAGDFTWIWKTLRRAQVMGLLVCVVPIATAASLDLLLRVWLGPGVVQSAAPQKVAFVLFGFGFVLHGVFATFAAGIGRLRLQLAFYGGGFIAKILVVWSCAARTDNWAVVPAMDGLILLAYCAAERRAIRGWLLKRITSAATDPVTMARHNRPPTEGDVGTSETSERKEYT